MKTLLTFLYYFFITILVLVALLLLILFGYAITDIAEFKTAIFSLFTPNMIYSFYIFIITIVIGFLIYNTGKFVIAIQNKNKQEITNTLLIGVPMLMGIITMIYLLSSWQ